MKGKVRGQDEHFMAIAIREARRALGNTSPNPCVGAVIVKEGQILAKGYHRKAGMPHAEVEALSSARGDLKGATMYVTLEPCNHYGRTPPCTDAIIKAGIRRVVIGTLDPNPHVPGGGAKRLREEGIQVEVGVLEEECRRLNEAYFKFVRTNLPFVYAKSAITLDGFTATSTGDSKWITGPKARAYAHRLRAMVDGVMVGSGTVIKDNPLLTVRHVRAKREPYRVIMDTNLSIPLESHVVKEGQHTLILVGDTVDTNRAVKYEYAGAKVIRCPTYEGRLDLSSCLRILGGMGIQSLLLEGGSTLMGTFVKERLIDKFYVFVATKLLGGDDGTPMMRAKGPREIGSCIVLREVWYQRLGGDLLISGYPDWPPLTG